jgi:hypothetical protein
MRLTTETDDDYPLFVITISLVASVLAVAIVTAGLLIANNNGNDNEREMFKACVTNGQNADDCGRATGGHVSSQKASTPKHADSRSWT